MNASDECSWSVGILGVLVFMSRAIDSIQPIKDLFERGGKFVVRRVSTRPECVSANIGDCVLVQVGVSRWEGCES